MALELGIWDVNSLLDEISIAQLNEWLIYSSIHPFGFNAQNLLFGSLKAVLVNLQRSSSSDTLYTANDFMYKTETASVQPEKDNAEDMLSMAKFISNAINHSL